MSLKFKRLTLVLLIVQTIGFAQQVKLSPYAQVSVITVGPGASLNDAFGHNAFRIKDVARGIDVTYGYGEYDFEAPHFYLKFAQGKLNYLLGRIKFDTFYNFYISVDRTMREQVLNLSPDEKQKVFDFLENNYKPENRRYLYDFFYDNCATRIRDVVEKTSDTKITFNVPEGFQPKTFRELIYGQVNRNSWGSLGIDLALGSVIDKEATPYEHMFLPKYIFEFFATATKDGQQLVKETHILYQKQGEEDSNDFWSSPLCILGILALLMIWITYKDYKTQNRSKILDIILFVFTSFIGVMMLLLWFATDHTATAQNYNLLWAFPINLFVVFQIAKTRPKPWIRKYVKLLIIMLALLTLHWVIGIQVFAIALIPLLIALAIRYIYLIYYLKNRITDQ